MKAKLKVSREPAAAQPSTVAQVRPKPPVIPTDLPGDLPVISQLEIVSYVDARDTFLIARADYEQKRSALTLKLLQNCLPESGGFIARLEDEGARLVVLSHCSCCHSTGDSHT